MQEQTSICKLYICRLLKMFHNRHKLLFGLVLFVCLLWRLNASIQVENRDPKSIWYSNVVNQIVHPLQGKRSFKIDQSLKSFSKDGLPFRFISGAIHYFRVHPDDWRDRLRKLRYAGFDTIETYVEWSSHEPEPGVYDFSGGLNLTRFIDIAVEEDLYVILRPGPYICAERDFGGFPYWLLREDPGMILRSSDENYLEFVDNYLDVLLPKMRSYMYHNGGPILMVQVENEYGSYNECDFTYTTHLRDKFQQHLGSEALLFTTDGDGTNFLKCGKIADVYATIDFGSEKDASTSFAQQRLFEPYGPLVNSEYYPGWLDHWGDPHETRDAQLISSKLDDMLAMNASVNVFVFHGGTSFGLKAGANLITRYQADPTSYDYDAPLSEAGDPTEKYYAIRNVTSKYVSLPIGTVPTASAKYAYGDVYLSATNTVFDLLPALTPTTSLFPLTFEALSVPGGIVAYQTTLTFQIPDPSLLSLSGLHDRGYIFVNSAYSGVVSREQSLYSVPIFALPNDNITIIVESQGRVGFGNYLKDFKGLTENVTIQGRTLLEWTMTPVPLWDSTRLQKAIRTQNRINRVNDPGSYDKGRVTFFTGSFTVPQESSHPQDTFLKLDGWTKGYVWVNDFLLGRYWPKVGPQVTLYIPHGILISGSNAVQILELQDSPCTDPSSCKITFVDVPQINGPTPEWS